MTDEVSLPSTPTCPPTGPAELTYMQTSQARNWRFSARQIEKMRQEGNEAAQKRLEQLWTKERSLPPVEGEPEASSSSASLLFLTVEEEQTLIAYYLSRVRQLVKAFGLPEVVEATTITYIKRFYLRNTCMDYHPKNIMLTCLFLAAKAESNAVPLKHFAQKLAGKDPSAEAVAEYREIVQNFEFLVSQSLSFEYTVHGAHRALHGLLLDLQMLPSKADLDDISDMLAPARAVLQRSRFTDAEFVYTPAQIALACIYSVGDAAKEIVDRYLREKERRAEQAQAAQQKARNNWRKNERARLERKGVKTESMSDALRTDEANDLTKDSLGQSTDGIISLLEEIGSTIEKQAMRATDSVESVREIDKKLKLCQNPQLMSNSRIAKQAESVQNGHRTDSSLGKRGVSDDDADDDDDDDEDDDAGRASNVSKRAKMDRYNQSVA